jgi:hypothetical protein
MYCEQASCEPVWLPPQPPEPRFHHLRPNLSGVLRLRSEFKYSLASMCMERRFKAFDRLTRSLMAELSD